RAKGRGRAGAGDPHHFLEASSEDAGATAERYQVAQPPREQEHPADAGEGELQGEVVSRCRVEGGTEGGSNEQRGDSVRAPASGNRAESDSGSEARPDRRPWRSEYGHLHRHYRNGANGRYGGCAQATGPGRAEPQPPCRQTDEEGHRGQMQSGAREQMDEPASGKVVVDVGRDARAVADPEG